MVATDARFKNLAADEYRTDIQAVPGSGDILGVALLKWRLFMHGEITTGALLRICIRLRIQDGHK